MCKVKWKKTHKEKEKFIETFELLSTWISHGDGFCYTPSSNQIAHLCFYSPTFTNEIVMLHLFLFSFHHSFTVFHWILSLHSRTLSHICSILLQWYKCLWCSNFNPSHLHPKCIYNPIPNLLSWTYCRDSVADGNIVPGIKSDLISLFFKTAKLFSKYQRKNGKANEMKCSFSLAIFRISRMCIHI